MDNIAMIQRAIDAFATRYQNNPFDCLYERDLQALLYCDLNSQFENDKILMRGGYHKNVDAYGAEQCIRTSPVKCEYPASRAFDIALIDADGVEHYDSELWEQRAWKNDRFWEQPVRAAIEIKYFQLGDSPSIKVAGFEADIAKLATYRDERRKDNSHRKFLGIALVCVQSRQLQKMADRLRGVGQKLDDGVRLPDDGIVRYVISPTDVCRSLATSESTD